MLLYPTDPIGQLAARSAAMLRLALRYTPCPALLCTTHCNAAQFMYTTQYNTVIHIRVAECSTDLYLA